MKSQPEAPEGLWTPLVRGVGSEEDRPLCRGPPVMSHWPQWESGYGSTCLHRILCTNFCACNVLNKRFLTVEACCRIVCSNNWKYIYIYIFFFWGWGGGELMYCCSIAKEPCLAIKIPMGPMKPGRPRQTPGASHGCQPATRLALFWPLFFGWIREELCESWRARILHLLRFFKFRSLNSNNDVEKDIKDIPRVFLPMISWIKQHMLVSHWAARQI